MMKKKIGGLTIVEVLVALVLLGVVILISAGLIIPLRVTRDSNIETQALSLARSYIELVRQRWLDPAEYEQSPSNNTVDPKWPTAGTATSNDLVLPNGWTLTTEATIRIGANRYSDGDAEFASSTNLRRFRDTIRNVKITITPNNGAKSVTLETVITVTNP